MRRALASLAMLAALLGGAAGAHAQVEPAALTDAAVVDREGALEIWVRLTRPARYQAELMDGPFRLVVDFEDTAYRWSAKPVPVGIDPVRVRVVNGGGVPLRLDAGLFALALPDGRRLAAAPVDDVRAVVAEPPPTSRPVAGLTLGPLREQSGPGWALSEAVPDPRSDPSQEVSRTWELPSADMVQSALPQGALAPGASASGFLYFEHAPAGTAPVSLTARLVDAHSGEPIGVVVVPLAPE